MPPIVGTHDKERAGAPREVVPDREREAGFRGDALVRASWLLGLVFVAGFAVIGVTLWSRRFKARQVQLEDAKDAKGSK